MYQNNCCRTCLGEHSLNPIFRLPEQNEKYSEVVLIVTGLKIEMNDSLPQQMCTPCINFINSSIKFRRKCEEAHKILLSRCNDKNVDHTVKSEEKFKLEHEKVEIEITELNDDQFNDHDDNIPLDLFQYEKDCTTVQEIVNSNDIFKKKKPVLHSRRQKKENRKDESLTEKKETSKESIECEYCHKVLTSKTSLRNHYKIHTGFDVVCEHCGKKFITRRLLLMHCRAKHGYEKTDKCSYCDYKASNAEQVKIHERLHTGEKPYVCKECSAGFHRKSSYLQHIAIHLPEKTVQCDQCPARFKSVTLMRIHKNRHRAPQYTFSCRVCRNTFARRRNVARHLHRIHGLLADDLHIQRVKIA